MSSIRFANVLLETNQRSLECPSMYCRANRPVFYRQEEQAWSLYGRGIFDFSTYFNALPVYKLKNILGLKHFDFIWNYWGLLAQLHKLSGMYIRSVLSL